MPLLTKADLQVALDSGPKTALSYPHWITTCRPLPALSAPHARPECPFRA